MHYINHYNSPLGGITLACNDNALTGLWFDEQKHFADTLDTEHETRLVHVLEDAMRWLDIYFQGRVPQFTPALALPHVSPFRRRVWEHLLRIPHGKVVTYGQLSQAIAHEQGLKQMSAQAVGGAVGHNPISIIIPCHRVVGASGRLTGYAGGIERKRELLKLEGFEGEFLPFQQ